MMNNLKYQTYLHHKLPITINPLDYGKLVIQIENRFVLTLKTNNVVVIKQNDKENYIKLFKKGELLFEYKDSIVNENTFIRTIQDNKFTFRDNKLIGSQVYIVEKYITVFDVTTSLSSLTPLKTEGYIINLLKNSYIYKHKKAELFIFFKLSLIFMLFLLLFVIFPENNDSQALIAAKPLMKRVGQLLFSSKNSMKPRKHKNRWSEKVIKINNKVFTRGLFEKAFIKFWSEIEAEFTGKNHIFILLKIKYSNGEYATIGKLQRLNKADYTWYIDWIIESMIFKLEYYNETQIESIIISYGFKKGDAPLKNAFPGGVNSHNYQNNKIPISMNPLDYGKIISERKIENSLLYTIHNKEGQTINFEQFDKYNEIEFFKSATSLVKYKDVFINQNKFVRIIDNKKYYFEDGEQILFQTEMKTKFIEKTQKNKDLINKFITLDIETYMDGETLTPFLISFYDGRISKSFYLSDYENTEQMILECFNSLFIRKYNGYKIYVHNLARFDIIFLLKYLVKKVDVQPRIHKGRFISLTVSFGENNEYQMEFRDSYLILLGSLRKLCSAFKVETVKSVFPFFFVNKNNLDYLGKIPELKYFIGISKEDYNEYTSKFNNNWNLKNEAIKYCEIDCISLYQVIYKFNEMIFNLFSVNIHKYPTLPSLAFGIFRSNFMSENTIPQISGKIAENIKTGYTGGAVDVYIPQSKPGVKINCYDVNSLYPSQMKLQSMPVGTPVFFKGDIYKFDEEAFGFFYCKIEAPDNILHPILQTRIKTKNGTRTVAPVGTWEDMLFSEELKNALKYGYKIEVLWGYTFERADIFTGYVDFLYSLRLQYTKAHPLNYIAKILLNSLYGRFGMDDNFLNINVIHKDYYPDFENKNLDLIMDRIELDEHYIVFYGSIDNSEESDTGTHNVSIGIAAAITAYSRIHMSRFKNNPEINLYYTDTDSIYTDSKIDETLIDNKVLGKLKLENICNKAIFLAPKVYCLETVEGQIIYKAKGLKHEIELTMSDFKHLLEKDAIIRKHQEKWFRKLDTGKIDILNQIYTLQVTSSKRQLIYDKNNEFISTKNYKITNSKNIT